VEAILSRQPLWLLEKLRSELPAFWAVHAQPVVHLERGAYGEVGRSRALAGVAIVLLPYVAVLLLFVLGLARVPASRATLLVLGFLAFYVLLHVAAHGYPRYRLPAMPALFLVAAHALAGALPERPAFRGPRRAATLAVAATLLLSVAPSLVGWARGPWPPPWFAGAGVEPGREVPSGDEAAEER
jgi:hypothetical protein